MATIAKKRKTTRRPGASKAPAKRKKVAGTPTATKKIAGVNFKHNSCHSSKSAASAVAEKKRAGGAKARVIKSGKAFCVYTRGKATRKRA